MEPFTTALLVAGGAQVINGIAGWLSSRSAQQASAAERSRIQGLLDALQSPNFDVRDIQMEDLQVLQKYVPESTAFVQEVAPKVVEAQSAGAQRGREAQLQSLGKFQQLMRQGYDPQTAMEMARAQRGASAEAASARASATQEAARRGFGGGLSMISAGADQAGQDRMAMLQQQALADAAQRRMAAAGQAANLGGAIRGEDVALERGNIDIINAYNQRMAGRQQDWANQQAGIRNEAQRYNIGEAQRIDEANKQNRYNSAVRNQTNRNTLGQQQFSNALSKVTGQQGQSQLAQQAAFDEAAQRNQAMQGVADFATKAAMMYDQRNWQQQQDKLKKG